MEDKMFTNAIQKRQSLAEDLVNLVESEIDKQKDIGILKELYTRVFFRRELKKKIHMEILKFLGEL
jgi:hypothetical protein